MMAGKSRACAACLRLQQQLSDTAQNEPQTLTCELGLSDTAVPIRFGERLVGFLQTGQVFRKKPTEEAVQSRRPLWWPNGDWRLRTDRLKQAYFGTKVLSSKQHEGVVKLLAIFAQHISMVSNQILVQRASAEPPAITRAKQFIQENQAEDLSLGQVAKAVNMSTFYFCKMFKKATGLNFTDYVSRVRVEKATKSLAQSEPPHQRNCLRNRLPIVDPLQSRLQENHRPIAHRIPGAIGFCMSSLCRPSLPLLFWCFVKRLPVRWSGHEVFAHDQTAIGAAAPGAGVRSGASPRA